MGGIPTAEMNSLELEFLFMINFTLNVTPEVYRQYEHELMMRTLFIYHSKSLGFVLLHVRADLPH